MVLCEKVAGSPVVGAHTRGLESVFHARWPRCGVFVVSPEGALEWGFVRLSVVLKAASPRSRLVPRRTRLW